MMKCNELSPRRYPSRIVPLTLTLNHIVVVCARFQIFAIAIDSIALVRMYGAYVLLLRTVIKTQPPMAWAVLLLGCGLLP